MKFKEIEIGTLDLSVIDGDRGKNYPHSNELLEDGYCLFLSANNVTKNGFVFNNNVYISKEKDEVLRKGKLLRNDIVITTRGTVGNVGLYDDSVKFERIRINSGMLIIRCGPSVDSIFLYHVLKSKQFYEQILSIQTGSAQPQLPKSHFLRMFVPNIPLPTQKQISSVLGTIDNKIATNTAINKNLAKQAQAIFIQHFIDIENTPDGWTEGSLTDIAEYLNGLAMQKFRPENEDDGLPVLKIKELRQGICDSESDRCSSEIKRAYIVHDGDVIFSWSGSLLVDFWCGGDCGLNQHLFKVTSAKYDKWFYYAWTNHHLQEFVKMAADRATTMGHIKRDALEKARVLVPNKEDYNHIGTLLQPLYDSIIANRIENRQLATLRDTLIPRLMSGEIDVSNIDI